jgi:hypothetical protein
VLFWPFLQSGIFFFAVGFGVVAGGFVAGGGGVTVGGVPRVIDLTSSIFTTLPPGSPVPVKRTSSKSPGLHGHGGGASATAHEIVVAFASVHVPELLLVTAVGFSAGPAVSTTDMITVEPVFETVSLYCPAEVCASAAVASTSCRAAPAGKVRTNPATSTGNASHRFTPPTLPPRGAGR